MRRALAFVLVCLALAPGAAFASNDAFWSQQWNMRVVRADKAWSKSKGSGIVVAVVDTGVDLGHPDLQGHLVSGYDFVDPGTPPQDEQGHGTHMAGIIAAATGNGEGVASVAPNAKIMPVRVLDSTGKGSVAVVADGIRWATDHGADVVNLSLAETPGGGVGPTCGFLGSADIDQAIKYARNHGVFVAIAAGNNFDSGAQASTCYDSTQTGVLVVGASTSTDKRAAYSNYGSGLDVLAPGGGSSSDPSACPQSTAIISTWWDKSAKESAYGTGCGTSMAVAHVSGLAALLMAKGYSNTSAANRIIGTAVDLGPPGRDNGTGYGRIDAAAAVGATSSTTPPPPAPKPKPKPSVLQKKVAAAGSPSPKVAPRSTTSSPSADPSLTVALGSTGPHDPPLAPRVPLVALATALMVATSLGHAGAAIRRKA
jgi:subtilisin family serine protease